MKRTSTMDNIKTINSVIRTLLLLVFVGAFGLIGWAGYQRFVKPSFETERIRKEMVALQVKFDKQGKELVKTQTALKLVKIDHRKATIEVVEKGIDESTGIPWYDVEFTEMTPEGVPLSQPRKFRMKGTMMYVDSWVIKFEDKYVEQADELRGGSLCVFKGLWGDKDDLDSRHTLDDVESDINTAYGALNARTELEKRIWDDFWKIANEPELQQDLGIRANHGQINYLQVEPGMIYEINLRASDGMTIKVARDKNT
jgi:hypothetical protein